MAPKLAVLTTLAEDMQALGLSPKKQTPVEAAIAETLPEAGIAEARIKRRLAPGGKSVQKTHKTPMIKLIKGRKSRRSAKGRKASRRQTKKLRTAKGKRHSAKIHAKGVRKGTVHGESVNNIGSLIQEVQQIYSAIVAPTSLVQEAAQEPTKAFANVAIIAEMLSNFFEQLSEDSEEFSQVAEEFEALAEDAAEWATALHEASEALTANDIQEMDEDFKEQLDYLLTGLEIFEEMTEGKAEAEDEDSEDEDSEDEDSDEDEDSEDDDSDEDDDEDSDDDKPAFLKKAEAKKKAGK